MHFVNEYNLNGAANKDLNRGVQSISYNLLNLPKVITQGSVTTTYTYDAAGNKLKVSTSGGITTDYISNKQYSNGVLDKIMIPQGYIQNGQYYYFTLDYLGNVRVISNSSGTVIEQNDYYPYGMRHENSSHIVSAGNRYKFSGKEVETTGNLSTLDFGWRQYDPQIGRWSVYDPCAESAYDFTPYNYALNDPVNYIDLDGCEAKDKKKDKDQNKKDGEGENYEWQRTLNELYFSAERPIYIQYYYYGFDAATWRRLWTSYGMYRFGFQNDFQLYLGNYLPIMFSNIKEAYAYMWENSFDQYGNAKKEISAWKTSQGVLVMPNYKNSLHESYNDYMPLSPLINGMRYVGHNYNWYLITGQIHTHPDYLNGKIGVSDADYEINTFINQPVTILWNGCIWEINGDKSKPIYKGKW